MPIRYFVTDRGTTGVTSTQFNRRCVAAFNTWDAVPTAQTSSQFVGFHAGEPASRRRNGDRLPEPAGPRSHPRRDNFMIDTTTGEIVESDIFFNSAFPWSVAAAGRDRPVRPPVDRAARDRPSARAGAFGDGRDGAAVRRPPRDRGGSGDVPDCILGRQHPRPHAESGRHRRHRRHLSGTSYTQNTGSISGKVTKSGKGVLGAHVVAFDTANRRRSSGGFSLSDDGSFVIAGLDPGPHILRAEPLDDGGHRELLRRDARTSTSISGRSSTTRSSSCPKAAAHPASSSKWWRSDRAAPRSCAARPVPRSPADRLVRRALMPARAQVYIGHDIPRGGSAGNQRRRRLVGRIRPRNGAQRMRRVTPGTGTGPFVLFTDRLTHRCLGGPAGQVRRLSRAFVVCGRGRVRVASRAIHGVDWRCRIGARPDGDGNADADDC